MATKAEKVIAAFDEMTHLFAKYFVSKYFGEDMELEWVANEIGGVAIIGDYFFNVIDMHDYIKYKYSRKQMYDHYDYALESHSNGTPPVNIKNWKSALSKN